MNYNCVLIVRLLFFCLLFFSSLLCAGEKHLIDNFSSAQPGDYVVFAVGKQYLFLRIHENNGEQVFLEEITLPRQMRPLDWRAWYREGCKGHSSWDTYTVSLFDGSIDNCYSLMRDATVAVMPQDSLIGTLLKLPFCPQPDKVRKRRGRSTQEKPDRRPFWHPRFVRDGTEIPNVFFDAWSAQWPKDGSELSGKTVVVYLPRNTTDYRTCFPFWLQVIGTAGKGVMRVVDSGYALPPCSQLLRSLT